MSAIAKPLVNFSAATNPKTFVPVEQVMSVEYIATPATSVTGPVTSTYTLLFTAFDPNNTLGQRQIKINFTTSVAAQAALTAFEALAAATL